MAANSMRILCGLLVALLFLLGLFQRFVPQKPLKDTVTFAYNEGFATFSAQTYRAIGFGYEKAYTSLLWLRFLSHTPPTRMKDSDVSWIFLDMLALTTIDPDFLSAYLFGGIFLSVVTEDKQGARVILEQGIRRFPKNWQLRAYLAYHYHHELFLPKLAAQQYRIASNLEGSPTYYNSLASKLEKEEKQGKELQKKMLLQLYENVTNEKVKKALKAKLDKLQVDK